MKKKIFLITMLLLLANCGLKRALELPKEPELLNHANSCSTSRELN